MYWQQLEGKWCFPYYSIERNIACCIFVEFQYTIFSMASCVTILLHVATSHAPTNLDLENEDQKLNTNHGPDEHFIWEINSEVANSRYLVRRLKFFH